METTPAACAMDWSIRLDKALRSNNPGKAMEAIKEVGGNLEWWSKEPELTMAEHDMFGLVPGEDKLFANAILLRLADTFTSGDKNTKLCVVKIFLSELRHRKTNISNRKNDGILKRYKVENHLELLKRIKLCFNSGDEEVRALALVLFGCWADFAKDNAKIRYLILSSLVSCHILEVKASLFAAGCFCEISDDFGFVLLEMLVNMVSSSEMPVAARLAGVRSFAKLGSSLALSTKAYEEGSNLISCFVEDDLVTNMLISLSIISSRSAILISRQVDLLHSFLTEDKGWHLQATSLRCLHIILSRRRFRFFPPSELINTIFNMFNGDLPPAMQCDALHILYEILVSKMLSFSSSEMHECSTKLLNVVKILMESPFISNRLFAMYIMADISGKFTRLREKPNDGDDENLASKAISILMSRIAFVANLVLKLNHPKMEMEKEMWSLLKIIFLLLNECPNLGEYALNEFHLLIKLNKDGVNKINISKFMICVSKFMILCLRSTVKDETLSSKVENGVKRIIEEACGCSNFDNYIHTVYHLLLHPFSSKKEMEECNVHEYRINNEILALEKAKKLVETKENWSAYNTGRYAAFQGAWFTSTFIFEELINTVSSESCNHWLTSLALFSSSEMKIQYCSSPNERVVLSNWLNSNRSSPLPIVEKDLGQETNLNHYIENFDEVCKILRSSKEILSTNRVKVKPDGQHYFQIQFLSLRENVLETVLHLFKFLETVSFQENAIRSNENSHLIRLSTRLMKLAKGYDLLATSFFGMDEKSMRTISTHALSCSVLAFVSGFCLFFANNNGLQNLESDFYHMLIYDLVSRIWHIEQDISKELILLLKTCFDQSKSRNAPQYKTPKLESYEVTSIVRICEFGVQGVIGLQDASKRMCDDKIRLHIIKDGLELLLNTIKKWLKISFTVPTCFFRVRPNVSCQLFSMNRDSGKDKKISVVTGYHLHLDLCLQLTNISPESRFRLTKLYCILQCKISNESQTQMGVQDWTDDNVLELNEKLFKHVNKFKKKHVCDDPIAETVVCFRPNGKGQGFSSCILDVSIFPLGCYEIKWHAGCIDIDGCYWSFNSLNSGPVFTVEKS